MERRMEMTNARVCKDDAIWLMSVGMLLHGETSIEVVEERLSGLLDCNVIDRETYEEVYAEHKEFCDEFNESMRKQNLILDKMKELDAMVERGEIDDKRSDELMDEYAQELGLKL